MAGIKNEDDIQFSYIRIIFGNKCITKMICEEYDRYLTFGEVLKIAKANGYIQGVIFVIAENALRGTIYLYGNYGPFWTEHGETRGYA